MIQVTEEILAAGAELFDLDLSRLYRLGGTDAAVFCGVRTGQEVVIRFEPAQAKDLPALQEKQAFVTFLAEGGASVARPQASLNAQLVELLDLQGSSWAVSLAEKAPGRLLMARNPDDWNPATFQEWGRLLGRLHALTRRYPKWQRQETDTAIQDWQDENAGFVNWCPDAQVRASITRLGERLQALPRSRENYGLVHNDLHLHNLLIAPEQAGRAPRLTAIDFGVSAYHWFANDIAISVFHAAWEGGGRRNPERCEFIQRFLGTLMNGYTSENQLDEAWLRRLPLFLKFRQMVLFTVLSDEWRLRRSPWQERILGGLRTGCLNDRPVFDWKYE